MILEAVYIHSLMYANLNFVLFQNGHTSTGYAQYQYVMPTETNTMNITTSNI